MTIDPAGLVVVLFAAYGAAVVAVAYGFVRLAASRQRVSRRSQTRRGVRR